MHYLTHIRIVCQLYNATLVGEQDMLRLDSDHKRCGPLLD